jgi:hypothetical protein
MRTGLRLVTVTTGAIALIGLGLLGCSPEQVVGNAQLPPNVADPKATETPAGAVLAYRGTLATFQTAFGSSLASVIVSGGLLADELQTASIGEPAGASDAYTPLDSRLLPEVQNPQLEASEPYVATYGWLHAVRGQAQEARGLLINFGGDTLRPLVGRLYATEGYADIFLADLFCSGIPLSTIDFGGDYTVRPGSSTTEVYQRAVTLMDSALTLASDSARFLNFARIGKGRALLALGQYVDAAQAVAQVPDGFQYEAFYVGGSAANTELRILELQPADSGQLHRGRSRRTDGPRLPNERRSADREHSRRYESVRPHALPPEQVRDRRVEPHRGGRLGGGASHRGRGGAPGRRRGDLAREAEPPAGDGDCTDPSRHDGPGNSQWARGSPVPRAGVLALPDGPPTG